MDKSDRKKRRRSLRISRKSVGPLINDFNEDDTCEEQLTDIVMPPLSSATYGSEWRESPKSDALVEKRKRRRSSRIHQLPVFRCETECSSSPELTRTKDVSSPEHHFKLDTPPSCLNYNAQTPTDSDVKSSSLNFNLQTPEVMVEKQSEIDVKIVLTPTSTSSSSKQEIISPEVPDSDVAVNDSFVTHRSSKHHNNSSVRSGKALLLDSPLFRKVSSPLADKLPYSPSQPMNLLSSPISQNLFESSFCQESPLKMDDMTSPQMDCVLNSQEKCNTPVNGRGSDLEQSKEHSSHLKWNFEIRTENPIIDPQNEEHIVSKDCDYAPSGKTGETDLCESEMPMVSHSDGIDREPKYSDGSSNVVQTCEVKCLNNNVKDTCSEVSSLNMNRKVWTLGELEKEFSQACTSREIPPSRACHHTYDVTAKTTDIESMDELSPLGDCLSTDGGVQDSSDFQMSGSSAESSEEMTNEINQPNCRRSTRMRRKSLETFQVTSNSENFKSRKKTKSLAFHEEVPLEDLYLNKKFVRPGDKSWETIFEMPVKGRAVGLKKLRRSILFENLTPSRLRKRQKKVKRLGVRKRQRLDDSFVQQKIAALDQELE